MHTEAQLDQALARSSFWERLYFWSVLLLGGLLSVLLCLRFPDFWRVSLFELLLFLVLNVIAEQTYVVLPRGSKISASFAIILVVMLVFNPPMAVLISGLGALISMAILQRRGLSIAAFNAGQYAITYALAGFAMYLAQHYVAPYAHFNLLLESLLSAGAATGVYLLVNPPLVNAYLTLKQVPDLTFGRWLNSLLALKDDRLEIFQTLFFYPIAVLVAFSYQQDRNPIIPVVLAFLVFGGLRFIDQRRRIERQGEKMQVLYHLTKMMSESVLHEAEVELSPSHVFDHLFTSEASSIKRMITNQRTSVYRVERLAEVGRIVHEKSDSLLEPEKVYLLEDKGLLQEIARTGQGVRLSNLSRLSGAYVTWRIGYQSLMAQPVLIDDETAYILVMFRAAGEPFQERDERLLKLLVNAFEITLKNLQLRNRIQAQAIKDGLMGVFNHRYMKLKLEEEMVRSKRYDSPLSMIIADLDYFKKFNDTHGHLLGDKALREIAGILSDSVRETDIVARYGGEELAILLPETPLQAACEVAERIRRNVAAHNFTGKDKQTVNMTTSIGVSCLSNEPDLEPSELIIRTDTALYRAKHQGRNQICRALVDGGRLIIETYSRGEAPQQAEREAEPTLLSPETLKLWDQSLEQALPDFLAQCRLQLQQAVADSKMERLFEKRLLGVLPEIMHLLGRVRLDESGELLEGSALYAQLHSLQRQFIRRLHQRSHLLILHQQLLRVYRFFIVQTLQLSCPSAEQQLLLAQGLKALSWMEQRFFEVSLDVVQEQLGQLRSQHHFARQWLRTLRQRGGRDALTDVLSQIQQSVPQAQTLFLARPRQGDDLELVAWLPRSTPLSVQLILQDRLELTPKSQPTLLELQREEVQEYLGGELPALPAGAAPVLIPLWHQKRLYGLLGLWLSSREPLSQSQRHWLIQAAREALDGLLTLEALEHSQRQPLDVLQGVVQTTQGLRGSFQAERSTALAARLGQRLGLSADEQQALSDAAALHHLSLLLLPGDLPAGRQRREAYLLCQRLLESLALDTLSRSLKHLRERWDGSGFPAGLSAQRIPLPARILALVLDALEQAGAQDLSLTGLEALRQTGYYDPKLCSYLEELIRESND